MVTDNLLFRVRTHNNPKLNDDDFVRELVDKLTKKYPIVRTYQYERESDTSILLFIWFVEPIHVIMD